MIDNDILINAMGNIDSDYIDESFERRNRRTANKVKVVKISSIAASVIVILIAVIILIPSNNKNEVIDRLPLNTASNDTEKSQPIDSIREILYSDNYGTVLSDKNLQVHSSLIAPGSPNSEVSPSSGKKTYDKNSGLYLIMCNTYYFKDYTVAVRVTYSMEYTPSDEYTYSENIKKLGEEFLAKNGLESSTITVIWEADGIAEKIETYDILFINIEKLNKLKAPEGLDIKFSLIPSWLDTGESTIHKDISLRPTSLE